MKLIKRNGVYYADLRDVGGGRVSLHVRVREDPHCVVANQRMREEYDKLGAVVATPNGAVTLGEVYKRCLGSNSVWLNAKDLKGIQSRWRRVTEFIPAETPMRTIDYEMLDGLVNSLAQAKLKPQTIKKHLSLLGPMFEYALPLRIVSVIPPMPKLKGAKSGVRLRVYTYEEEEAIIHWWREIGEFRMADLTMFLIDTGFRVSEAFKFELRGNKALLFEQKNNTHTATPLTVRAQECAIRMTWKDMSPEWVTRLWMRVSLALKLGKGATPHAMRHTCASRLVSGGADIKQVKDFMRHADIATTMKYVKLLGSGLDDCAKLLEKCATAHQDSRHSGSKRGTL